jgi:hypothetical protein
MRADGLQSGQHRQATYSGAKITLPLSLNGLPDALGAMKALPIHPQLRRSAEGSETARLFKPNVCQLQRQDIGAAANFDPNGTMVSPS